MINKYYRIIEINFSNLKTNAFKRTQKDNKIYHFSRKKDCDLNELYCGILPYCLDTIELEKQCRSKRNESNTNYPTGFSFISNNDTLSSQQKKKQPFQGYSNALIKVSFPKPSSTDKTKTNHYRKNLYENGFYFDDLHYVRYKRSASGAKNNQCLFIAKDLYEIMNNWSCHYLCFNDTFDLTSWEAYYALTLSGLETTFSLPAESILIMKDVSSDFEDSVITLDSLSKEYNPNADSIFENHTTKVMISNNLWDGESLLDTSVFESLVSYRSNSMLLLRSHFFKSCAFRTNLQKWFKDNNITKVSQLNGYTKATQVSDIKLVITQSSLKYLKFIPGNNIENGLEKWLDKQKKVLFGIVKTDHPPHHMNGTMTTTNYQFLNSIGLSEKDVKKLLKPSLEYLISIKQSPLFLRHYIQSELLNVSPDNNVSSSPDTEIVTIEEQPSCQVNLPFDSSANYKYTMFRDLISLTDNFSGTKMYQNMLDDISYNFRRKLKLGKILVEGTYATIFGNPAEFLYATIHKGYSPNKTQTLKYNIGNESKFINPLKNNQVFSTRFDDKEMLCCVRSPHITMGNVFLGENTTDESKSFYKEYFVLSDQIICINAIQHNIQQMLNGADYDSDTMLITNNETLVSAAKRQHFPIPYNNLTPEKFEPVEISLARKLAKIDYLIGNNNIGKIVNLSQILNSLWWTFYNKFGAENEDSDFLYQEICRLAILSNIEIDNAKRKYNIDITDVLSQIKATEVGMNLYVGQPLQNLPKNKLNDANAYCYTLKDLPEFISYILTSSSSRTYDDISYVPLYYGKKDIKPQHQCTLNLDSGRTALRNLLVYEDTLSVLQFSEKEATIFQTFTQEHKVSFAALPCPEKELVAVAFHTSVKNHLNPIIDKLSKACIFNMTDYIQSLSATEKVRLLTYLKSQLYTAKEKDTNDVLATSEQENSSEIQPLEQSIENTEATFTITKKSNTQTLSTVKKKINHIIQQYINEITSKIPADIDTSSSTPMIPSVFKYKENHTLNVYSYEDDVYICIENVPSESTCTMAQIYDVITKKEYEKQLKPNIINSLASDSRISHKQTGVNLHTLITTPTTKGKNDGTRIADIKKCVCEAAQNIYTLHNSPNYKEGAQLTYLEIINNCFANVEKLLSRTKYYHNVIYRLLKEIDNNKLVNGSNNPPSEVSTKSGNDQQAKPRNYSSLLLGAICNAKSKSGESLFYSLVLKKAFDDKSIPTYTIGDKKTEGNSTIYIHGRAYTITSQNDKPSQNIIK